MRYVARESYVSIIYSSLQNFFKFDGIGGGISADGAPPDFANDILGLIRLVSEIRQLKVCLLVCLYIDIHQARKESL